MLQWCTKKKFICLNRKGKMYFNIDIQKTIHDCVHYISKSKNIEIIEFYIENHSNIEQNQIICKYLSMYNNIDPLIWMYNNKKCQLDYKIFKGSLYGKNIEFLDFMRKNNFDNLDYIHNENILKKVCIKNSLNLKSLKWLDKNNMLFLSSQAYKEPLKYGMIKIVKWLIKKKCPFDQDTCYYSFKSNDIEIIVLYHSQNNKCCCCPLIKNAEFEYIK